MFFCDKQITQLHEVVEILTEDKEDECFYLYKRLKLVNIVNVIFNSRLIIVLIVLLIIFV